MPLTARPQANCTMHGRNSLRQNSTNRTHVDITQRKKKKSLVGYLLTLVRRSHGEIQTETNYCSSNEKCRNDPGWFSYKKSTNKTIFGFIIFLCNTEKEKEKEREEFIVRYLVYRETVSWWNCVLDIEKSDIKCFVLSRLFTKQDWSAIITKNIKKFFRTNELCHTLRRIMIIKTARCLFFFFFSSK